MLEAELWQMIKHGLSKQPHLHMCRVEDSAGSGMPDVDACRDGATAKVELKVTHGRWLHFRNSQRSWTARRAVAGGAVFVLAYCDGSLYLWRTIDLFSESMVHSVDDKSFKVALSDAMPLKLDAWSKPYPWNGVADALFSIAETKS